MGTRLVGYLKRKDKLLFARTGIHLYNEEDFKEALSWDKEKDDSFLELLKDTIREGLVGDSDLCPWCVFLEMECSECNYGKRHRICVDKFEESTYKNMIIALNGKSIRMSIPNIKMLFGIKVPKISS